MLLAFYHVIRLSNIHFRFASDYGAERVWRTEKIYIKYNLLTHFQIYSKNSGECGKYSLYNKITWLSWNLILLFRYHFHITFRRGTDLYPDNFNFILKYEDWRTIFAAAIGVSTAFALESESFLNMTLLLPIVGCKRRPSQTSFMHNKTTGGTDCLNS